MSTIDAHVHLYPPELNQDPRAWAEAAGEPRWAALCVRRRKNGQAVQSFPSVDELLRQMDQAAVERAVLLGWYWEQAASCEMQNRFYAECVRRHPRRLSAFASVQPASGGKIAVDEMRRAREEGLIGVGELSPHAQGYATDSEEFAWVLRRAEEWGWPVNLHVTDPQSGGYPGRVETPLPDFVQLARTWPAVTFVLAHWGGGLAFDDKSGGVADLPNVYFDTAASPLLYPPAVWSRTVAGVGAQRILFGSDYPLNLYPKVDAEPDMGRFVAEAESSRLDRGDVTAILGSNASRVIFSPR